jgi:hypothetical protein
LGLAPSLGTFEEYQGTRLQRPITDYLKMGYGPHMSRQDSKAVMGFIGTFRMRLDMAIEKSPKNKVILFNLDGINLDQAAQQVESGDGYTAQELKLILSTPEYRERTRFFRNNRELKPKEITQLARSLGLETD